MNKVCACIDGLANTAAVIDWAAWSARSLDAPLNFLHVLERHPERAALADHSGAIGLGAQEGLLRRLAELDEQRGRLAQEAGRQLLEGAARRVAAAGVPDAQGLLRHGELVDAALELEADTRLFVLGEHPHGGGPGKLYMDHHVERLIRSVKRPVLVATGAAFSAPTRAVIAFDASATARKMIDTVARSPMLKELPLVLAMCGLPAPDAAAQLEAARLVLATAGFTVRSEQLAGDPESALPAFVQTQGQVLLVMGAYGHTRIRQLIVGSTTTTLLRTCPAPVLILR